jgi:hypothetical protein
MTTAQALEIARHAKPLPRPRVVLDKAYAADALAKLSGTVAAMNKQLSWARDGIALVADAKNIKMEPLQ